MEPTRYRLYHTQQPGFEVSFPKNWFMQPERAFRTNYVLIFGAGNTSILSIRMGNEEQLAQTVPAFMFEPQGTSIRDVEKWCADGSLGMRMSQKRMPGMVFPSVHPGSRIVVELSDAVECICLGGIELIT